MGLWQSKNQIPELNDVTLSGTVSIGNDLGSGAYGKVFSVQYREKSTDKTYAAKQIHPVLIEGVNPEDREAIKDDFVRECLRCSVIHHPNIVEFVGVYYSNQSGIPIMVMELMETSLNSFIENNKSNIAIETKISILFDVSCGLTFLHTRKPPVIHRDLSSKNVMLTSKLVAKIGDLGLAKVIRSDRTQTKSKLSTAPGCLDFMPPETLVADPVYSFPVDVFSFAGITLHVFSEEWPSPGPTKVRDPETGKYVAPTEAGRRQQYLDKMTGGAEVTSIRQLVERCLDDDPDERPPIQEVKEMIEPMVIREEEVQHGSRRMSTNQKKTDKMKKVMKGKSRATVQHPKYSEMITAAVVSINEQGGCSRQKILKYIGANYEVSDGYEVRARLALNQMVRTGALIQTKGTGASGAFKLANKSSKRKTSKTKKSPVKKTTKK